jgi:3-dehydroquinate synthase
VSGADPLAFIPAPAARPTPVYAVWGAVTDGELLVELLHEHRSSPHILIADEQVHRLFGESVVSRLRAADLDVRVLVVPAGESAKSEEVYLRLLGETLDSGVDKGSHVLTLGGGTTSNVGGFVAATVFRGLPLIHLPTSLMAQLDAAVDVRQAINHERGKNLIGAMYAPKAVIIDSQLLTTLPLRHLRSGMAEAIKHALTQSAAFVRELGANAHRLTDAAYLDAVVRETLRLKLKLLKGGAMRDLAELHLQYGHCIGHAIEAASAYALLHGEAIAIGMAVSARIAAALGICSSDVVRDHLDLLQAYGLPVDLPADIDAAAVTEAATRDKNAIRQVPRLVLPWKTGRIYRVEGDGFVSFDADVLLRHLLGACGRPTVAATLSRRTGNTRSRRSERKRSYR